MIPVRVQKLILSDTADSSILVLCSKNYEQEIQPRFIPIFIGLPEAAQIGLTLEDIRLPRPLTHDLFIDALTNLDSYIDHVLITDVKGSIFYATLTLRHHDQLIELDARPSDAIALAIKQNADIFVLETVFQKASFPFEPSFFKEEDDLEAFHAFVANLNPDDFKDQIS